MTIFKSFEKIAFLRWHSAKEFISPMIFPKRLAGTISEDILNLISGLSVLATRYENSVENVLDVPKDLLLGP